MKQQIVIGGLFLVLAFGAAVAFSKEPERPAEPQGEASPAVKGLIDELGDQAFAVRRRAAERILELGEKAVPELEKAAKDHPDEHVRYEAERLLVRIRGDGAEARRPRGDEDFRRLEESMNGLLRELEASGLLDEAQLERLRDMMRRPPTLVPPPGRLFGGGLLDSGTTFHGSVHLGDRKLVMDRGADGRVTVEITENGETKTYEAESMEALEKEHPDVHALVTRHFSFGGLRGRVLDRLRGPLGEWPPLPGVGPTPVPRGERPLEEKDAGLPAEGFRLGIWIGEMSEPLRYHLDLPEGVGLLVESVVPESLADRVGMQRLDVLVSVNGQKVGDPGAVRTLLGEVPEGGQVTLEVVRKGRTVTLVGTR